jgi:hypothetical protein
MHKLPHATPVERRLYVETTYWGRKKVVYSHAADVVERRGLKHSDSYLSPFSKVEKIACQNKRLVPRIIQPRSPVYNVELGRYIHPMEHAVYQAIDHTFGHPTVMKGLNAFQQGTIFHDAWASFRCPMALMIDASRFDQHIRTGLLSWEHGIYNEMFGHDEYLANLLRWQLKSTGFARSGGKTFRYTVKGGRCSGDMNTAMGNVLIACAGVYAWLHSQGVVREVRVLDAGDDCCIIGEGSVIRRIAPTLQPWFAQLGLIMKVEPLVDVLEQVSFCQTQPIYDGHVWRMCRDPRQTLSKDGMILSAGYLRDLSDYCASIGTCGLSLTGGLPVLQEYYTALGAGKALSGPVDERLAGTGFFRLARGCHAKYQPVTDTARVSFWRAFGITPTLQVELEARYRSWTVPTNIAEFGEIDRIDLGPGVAICN